MEIFLVIIVVLIIVAVRAIIFPQDNESSSYVRDYYDIRCFLNNKEPRFTYKNQMIVSLTPIEEEILKQNFPYYNKLKPDKQIIFGYRIKRFIEGKQFIGMEGLEIDDKIKLLISATASKITFGLPDYRFENFKIIRVYPQQYYSELLNSYMYGGTSAYGVISLAWDKFMYGFENTEDNINLGFHEFAHALILYQQNEVGITSFRLYSAAYDEQAEYAKEIMRNDDFFREYAYTNDMEFFAVVVEHFFENPLQLKQTLPLLYNSLTKLLLQDPASAV